LTNASPIAVWAPMLPAQAASSSPPAPRKATPVADTSDATAFATRAASLSGFTPARATSVG
jgi:hypothetical protein